MDGQQSPLGKGERLREESGVFRVRFKTHAEICLAVVHAQRHRVRQWGFVGTDNHGHVPHFTSAPAGVRRRIPSRLPPVAFSSGFNRTWAGSIIFPGTTTNGLGPSGVATLKRLVTESLEDFRPGKSSHRHLDVVLARLRLELEG
jgi:hypothetical protein